MRIFLNLEFNIYQGKYFASQDIHYSIYYLFEYFMLSVNIYYHIPSNIFHKIIARFLEVVVSLLFLDFIINFEYFIYRKKNPPFLSILTFLNLSNIVHSIVVFQPNKIN